jgi:hypothetical protein
LIYDVRGVLRRLPGERAWNGCVTSPSSDASSAARSSTILDARYGVDHVVVFDENTPEPLLEHVHPDVLVKGGTTAAVVGSEIVPLNAAPYGSSTPSPIRRLPVVSVLCGRGDTKR